MRAIRIEFRRIIARAKPRQRRRYTASQSHRLAWPNSGGTSQQVWLARDAGGVIDFVPPVGDFVASADHYSACTAAPRRSAIARCEPRTPSARNAPQDATFAFRVIVDVAVKALSRAINDPTTAVIALDQIHRLLRVVGRATCTTTPCTMIRGRCG